MTLVYRQHTDCVFLLNPDYADIVTCDWFKMEFWHNQNKTLGKAQGRGNAVFFTQNNTEYVLRHYLRGGQVAKISKDKYLFLGLKRTRSFAEMRLNDYLYKKGLPVAVPVAAKVIRHGLIYSADFISIKIANSQTLLEYIKQNPEDMGIWQAVGKTIKQFHDIGLNHTDLNIRNILVDNKNRIFLIDFDKCHLKASVKQKAANLVRLRRSINKETKLTNSAYTKLELGYNKRE